VRRETCQPSYSKPILSSTLYSTIQPSSAIAVDYTTSRISTLQTVPRRGRDRLAGRFAPRLGPVPTISRVMMTAASRPPRAVVNARRRRDRERRSTRRSARSTTDANRDRDPHPRTRQPRAPRTLRRVLAHTREQVRP
jgi:hypothetical protein